MRGVPVRRDIYVSVAGTDLVRLPDGQFAVLEDNLRVPSGVSYMLTNRAGHQARLPGALQQLRRPPDRSLRPGAARDAARAGAGAPPRSDDRRCSRRASTTRRTSSTRSSRAQMGIELVEGRDLFVHDNIVYMRTTGGPAARRRDLPARRRRLPRPAGVPRGLAAGRGRASSTRIAPATSRSPTPSARASPTTRRSTPTCPAIIRFYLGEEPILPNVETYLLRPRADRAVRARAPRRAGGEGGRRIRRLRHADRPAQHRGRARGVPRADRWPTRATTSRSRRWRCRARRASSTSRDRAAPRRPAARTSCYGDDVTIVPGGLTRVALRQGSLVVNSSQGGGSKDTWVLEDST